MPGFFFLFCFGCCTHVPSSGVLLSPYEFIERALRRRRATDGAGESSSLSPPFCFPGRTHDAAVLFYHRSSSIHYIQITCLCAVGSHISCERLTRSHLLSPKFPAMSIPGTRLKCTWPSIISNSCTPATLFWISKQQRQFIWRAPSRYAPHTRI